jgi:hypothetical protein
MRPSGDAQHEPEYFAPPAQFFQEQQPEILVLKEFHISGAPWPASCGGLQAEVEPREGVRGIAQAAPRRAVLAELFADGADHRADARGSKAATEQALEAKYTRGRVASQNSLHIFDLFAGFVVCAEILRNRL